jgi:iron(III) transport system permease protein
VEGLVPREFRALTHWRTLPFTLAVTLGFGVLVLLPLALVMGQAVMPGLIDHADLTVSLARLQTTLSDPRSLTAILHTIVLGGLAAGCATALGFAYALMLARTDTPGRRLLAATPWLVFLTPAYLKALAWVLLMSPGGYLQQFGLLSDGASDAFFGLGGLVFVHTLNLFPLAVFIVGSAMRGLGGEFEDAARTVGAASFGAWWRINLPLLAPAVALAFLAMFAEVASDFGLASTIARTSDFGLLTYAIYTATQNYPVDFPLAGSQALVLLAILSAVLLLDRTLRRQRSLRLITGRSRPARIYRLGPWRWAVCALAALVSLLSVGLPLGAIVLRALARTLSQGLVAHNITWRWIAQALTPGQEANLALVRSLGFAALTALISGVLALLLAWRLDLGGRILRNAVLAVAMGAIAIPGVVMGLGFILTWDRLPGFADTGLYGTWPLLVLGYVSAALPYALVIVLGAIGQIAPSLHDAARLHGAGPVVRLARITVPLIASSLITAVLFVFVRTVFELPISQLLQPTAGGPAPVVIVRLFGNDDDGIGSALSLLAILATGGIAGAVWLAARGLGRHFWRNGVDSLGGMPGGR